MTQAQAAYELLARLHTKANALTQLTNEVLSLIHETNQLLRVQENVQAQPLSAFASPVSSNANNSQYVEIALWARGNDQLSGNFAIKEGNTTVAELRVLLFKSKPNENGMLYNGYILSKDRNDSGGSISDNSLGGMFIRRGDDGTPVMSGFLEETSATNRVELRSTKIEQVDKTANEKLPDLRVSCSMSVPLMKAAAQQMMGVQGTANASVLEDTASSSGLLGDTPIASPQGEPADPIFGNSPHTVDLFSNPSSQNSGAVSVESLLG